MRVVDTGDINDLPKLQIELTADELYKIVGCLELAATMLERSKLYTHNHRAEHYRVISQRLDDGYAELVDTPRIHVDANVYVTGGGCAR